MKKKLSNFSHLQKSIFLLSNPRSGFTTRNGKHARDRFYERYGYPLSEFEYELINLKILLGDYELLAYEENTSSLYRGIFKEIVFYAIFQPYEGSVVTFLEDDMFPSFLNRQSARITKIDSKIIKGSYHHKEISRNFISKIPSCELVYFDSHENFSLYKTTNNKYVFFSHKNDLIIKEFLDFPFNKLEELLEFTIMNMI